MTLNLRQHQLHSIARWALVLFVMAWINLVIQSPLHAAMKQPHSDHCASCETSLCDLVLGMEEQADDALGFGAIDLTGFQVAFIVTLSMDAVASTADMHYRQRILDFRQYSPPPLLLKTTLLI